MGVKNRCHANETPASVGLNNNYVRKFFLVALPPGSNYVLSFYLATRLAFDSTACEIRVSIGSKLITQSLLDAFMTPFQYRQMVIPFTIIQTSNAILIQFTCPAPSLKDLQFQLDDISLTG